MLAALRPIKEVMGCENESPLNVNQLSESFAFFRFLCGLVAAPDEFFSPLDLMHDKRHRYY
jgi:hypothetical protein